MFKILYPLAAAALSSAQLTTSIPIARGSDQIALDTIGYVGSVVDVKDGATTFVVRYDDDTLNPKTSRFWHYSNGSDTMVYYGKSSYAITSSGDPDNLTFGGGCTLGSSTATCSWSTRSSEMYSEYCKSTRFTNFDEPITTSTEVIHFTNSDFSSSTIVRTFDLSFCKSGSQIPASFDVSSATDLIVTTAKFVITAGQEKLSATAGSSPTTTGPRPTETGATGTAGTRPKNTGAAVPLIAMPPALAGLGAAMAVLL